MTPDGVLPDTLAPDLDVVFCGVAAGRRVDYGEQAGLSLGGAVPWALPSTSGAARGYWSVEPWRTLAAEVQRRRP